MFQHTLILKSATVLWGVFFHHIALTVMVAHFKTRLYPPSPLHSNRLRATVSSHPRGNTPQVTLPLLSRLLCKELLCRGGGEKFAKPLLLQNRARTLLCVDLGIKHKKNGHYSAGRRIRTAAGTKPT